MNRRLGTAHELVKDVAVHVINIAKIHCQHPSTMIKLLCAIVLSILAMAACQQCTTQSGVALHNVPEIQYWIAETGGCDANDQRKHSCLTEDACCQFCLHDVPKCRCWNFEGRSCLMYANCTNPVLQANPVYTFGGALLTHQCTTTDGTVAPSTVVVQGP